MSAKCEFYRQFLVNEKLYLNQYREKQVDIEEMANLGKYESICPYYFSRALSKFADIIFLPYNYILDNDKRRQVKEMFPHSIIIFDEAHNIERVAEDGESYTLSTDILSEALLEVREIKKLFDKGGRNILRGRGKEIDQEELKKRFDDLCVVEQPMRSLEKNLSDMKKQYIKEAVAKGGNGNKRPWKREKNEDETHGGELKGFDELAKIIFAFSKTNQKFLKEGKQFDPMLKGIDETNVVAYVDRLKKVMKQMKEITNDMAPANLEKVVGFLEIFASIIKKDTKLNSHKKKHEWEEYGSSHYMANIEFDEKGLGLLSLHLWCLLPAMAFRGILKSKTHSLIFTSGTMDPISGFESQLGQSCSEILRNPHIIDPRKQVLAAVVKRFRHTADPFNFSFKNRENEKHFYDLGRIVSKSFYFGFNFDFSGLGLSF